MTSPLPRAWDLIKDSWNAFVKTWETTVRITAWLILAGVLQNIALFFVDDSETASATASLVGLVGIIAAIAIGLWVSIVLYRLVLAMDRGESMSPKVTENVWALVPSLLLIGIMQAVASFGATLLLIIPGIYVSVRLAFSQLTLFTKNLKGRAALAESWALTKNRFWAVLGRQLLMGVMFVGVFIVVSIAAAMIVGIVSGGKALDSDSPTASAIYNIISSIIQAAIMPLMVIFQVKLYKALERTRAV